MRRHAGAVEPPVTPGAILAIGTACRAEQGVCEMEEVRLWKIDRDGSQLPRVERVESVNAVATEKLLEDLLAHSPEVLMDGLTIIGRQNETAGGPLDLLGVDDDGNLVVFELKRGELTRDAVAQVVDYASWLASLDSEKLCEHIAETSGRNGTEKIASFPDWYRENFEGKSVGDIGRPRMVLVGLGADDKAKRMVEFLAAGNVDISLITFYGFTENGETLLARHVEVEGSATKETNRYRATKAANQEKFEQRLRQHGVEEFYSSLLDAFGASLKGKGTAYPNANGHTFYFPDQTESGAPTTRAYAGFSVPDGKVPRAVLVLHPRAAGQVGAQDLEDLAKMLGAAMSRHASGTVEFSINATVNAAGIRKAIENVGAAVVRAWEDRRRATDGSLPQATVA